MAILTIDVSLRFDFPRLLPLVFDITLSETPESTPAPEPSPQTKPEEAVQRATAPVATPSPDTRAAEGPDAGPAVPVIRPPTDWQDALQRASAATVEDFGTPDSLHPEFDELRRIAKQRYSEPKTGIPPPIWENVEKDIYGRTLLRSGNCFVVLDDTNVGNRYAFETFERHLVSCAIGFGKRRPQNLPWVEIIQAKYPHLRDPDGSRSAAGAKEVGIPGEDAFSPGSSPQE